MVIRQHEAMKGDPADPLYLRSLKYVRTDPYREPYWKDAVADLLWCVVFAGIIIIALMSR